MVSVVQAQQQQAGVTAAVRGQVELASAPGAVGKLVRSGEPVYLGNAIKSGPASGLQLLLLDQTTFTIGPDSELTIDQFVYDPATGAGKVAASVAKGVFRFVTGKVAQNDPANMTVKLPVGTIGIRGTIAMGSVDRPNSQNFDGLRQQVVLVGPGSNLDSKDRVGAIVVGQDNTFVNINRPGFGSQWGFGSPGWGDPIKFTNEMVNAIQSRLNPPPPKGSGGQPGGGGGGGQAIANAGAGGEQSKGGVQQINQLTGMIAISNQLQTGESQPIGNDAGAMGGGPVIDGIANFAQLRAISGTYNFSQTGVPIGGGTYDISINLDAGSRQIATPGSYVELKTPTVSGKGVPSTIDYSGSPAAFPVVFDIGSGQGKGDFVGTGCGASNVCDGSLLLAALNANGQTANSLLHALSVFTDTGGFLMGGAGIAGRQNGTVPDPNPILNGTSTFEQLRTVTSGQFNYSQGGVALSGGGSYNMVMNIDFGARQVGGMGSQVVVNGTGYSGSFALGPTSFAGGSGPSNFIFNSTAVTGGICATNCNAMFQIAPQNANGTVGQVANHNLVLRDGSNIAIVSQGNGVAPRAGGLVP